MKIKVLIAIVVGLILSFEGYSQKVLTQKVAGVNMVVIDCSYLPISDMKTRAEIDASKTVGGRLHRHSVNENFGVEGQMNINAKISPKFAISKCDINAQGKEQPTKEPLTWGEASGWTDISVYDNLDNDPVAQNTGCAAYNSGDGAGKWRLPTQRELMLIWSMRLTIEAQKRFTPFTKARYWSATECEDTATAWFVDMEKHSKSILDYAAGWYKFSAQPVARCVRDI